MQWGVKMNQNIYLNSTMVLLLHEGNILMNYSKLIFKFHYGATSTTKLCIIIPCIFRFKFHYGATSTELAGAIGRYKCTI